MRLKEFILENPQQPSIQPSSSGPTLTFNVPMPRGNRGPEIADLQKSLVAFGYRLPRFGVDGIRGQETSAAIRQFQQDNGLKVDGIPGPETIRKVNSMLSARPDIAANLVKSTSVDVKARAPVRMSSLKQNSETQGKIGEILDFIARYESAGDYNIISGGRSVPELTKMSITDVVNFQNRLIREKRTPSSAVGRYQYIRDSLLMVVNQMGINPNNTLFDQRTQDAIATYDLRRRAQLDSWLEGKISDEVFLNRIAKIWAGIPTTGGLSAYHNVGNNKAGISAQNALATLKNIKSGTTLA